MDGLHLIIGSSDRLCASNFSVAESGRPEQRVHKTLSRHAGLSSAVISSAKIVDIVDELNSDHEELYMFGVPQSTLFVHQSLLEFAGGEYTVYVYRTPENCSCRQMSDSRTIQFVSHALKFFFIAYRKY